MAIALVDVREGVQDKYTLEDLTTARLDRFIAAAVRFYSQYNPKEDSDTLTTVANQQDYALPSDFVVMNDVEWYPSGQLFGNLAAGQPAAEYEMMLKRPARYHHPSDRIIETINRSALADATAGKWEVVGNKVRLWPAPSSAGEEITYHYGACHALNEDKDGYDDIPVVDLDIVVKLTLAEVLEASLVDVSGDFDYAEGLQRVTKHFVPGNLMRTIQVCRDSVRGKYPSVLGTVS
jgi:hypothetical protein